MPTSSVTYEHSSWGQGVEPSTTTTTTDSSCHSTTTTTTTTTTRNNIPLDLWRPLLVVAFQLSLLHCIHDVAFTSGPHDLLVSLAVPTTTTILYLSFVAWGLHRLQSKSSKKSSKLVTVSAAETSVSAVSAQEIAPSDVEIAPKE